MLSDRMLSEVQAPRLAHVVLPELEDVTIDKSELESQRRRRLLCDDVGFEDLDKVLNTDPFQHLQSVTFHVESHTPIDSLETTREHMLAIIGRHLPRLHSRGIIVVRPWHGIRAHHRGRQLEFGYS